MKRMRLRTKLMLGMLVILCVSVGLVASQAVLLFREDKSAYVFDLNASQAIKIADEVQSNVRHLTEKMRIFSNAVVLKAPADVDPRTVLQSMLREYPEFLLFSRYEADGVPRALFQSAALKQAGLTVDAVHRAYLEGGISFDKLEPGRPFIGTLGHSEQLPTITIAIREPVSIDGKPGAILIAECPLHRLYAAAESSLFEIYITDSAGLPLLSITDQARPESGSYFTELLPQDGNAGTREYDASGVPMLAAYSPVGDLGLWTVVQIPEAEAFAAAQQLITRSLVLAGLVCAVAAVLALLYGGSVTRSLAVLTRATEQIGRGEFDVEVPVDGGDEIGALGERFQRMGEELKSRDRALKEANERMVESEKMSAMGQLGAGIAHEVKNPLASIRGYAQLGLRKLPKDHPLAEYFQTIEKETGRSLEILKNLLKFARQETAEMSRIELNAVVAETIKLVKHPLGMKKVHVETKQCAEPLYATGNANQIEQVLLNLFMNAGDAMEEMEGGTLTVTTDIVDGSARIRSTDTGCGIPQDKISKIFNPFFTTKPVGKGTGLGLSVSYGIIKEHMGEVTVQSEVGKGTTFTILIPLAAEQKSAVATPAVEKNKPAGVISLT